jgi:hydrogenase-4 component B
MMGWVGATDIPLDSGPFTKLGIAHLTLAYLAIMAGYLLWRKVRANGLRRDLTWDCGYAKPTAKMQYTGGSFSGIGAGWFGWLLQPVRKLRRPRGQFPTGAIRLERTSETVLEKLLLPLGRVFMRVSTAVRRLQHGRLQTYIFYVLVGLFSLGVFVLLGGML